MNRLTRKYSGGYGLVKVKDNEQDVESPYPNTLRAILECFNCLGELEDSMENGDLIPSDHKHDGNTSDGYHTFNELYHHRAVLFSVIVSTFKSHCWKSKFHHDGTKYDGMFIVGIDTPQGQATYHYDIDPYWDMFDCKVFERAPEYDGHSPSEAIERIGGTREIIPKVIETLNFVESATGVSDAYTQGFCNGLIYARALLEGKTPIYRSADEWINRSNANNGVQIERNEGTMNINIGGADNA